MTVNIKVIEGGLFTTLQDLGRTVGRPYGVPPGGALDRYAHSAANELVGNLPTAATLEIFLQAPSLHFENNALISITGADFRPEINGVARPMWASLFVRGGETLRFRGASNTGNKGRLVYLAIHGGWDAPLLMGSRATYIKAEFGGYKGEGRALSAGDGLTTADDYKTKFNSLAQHSGRFYPAQKIPQYSDQAELKIIPGPFEQNFSEESLKSFYRQTYMLSEQSDRMGYRLSGTPLEYAAPEMAEIAACGTVFGAIQAPPDGQPIVLMSDHQLTGGYPIIGVVAKSSLSALAQLLPGATVTLRTLNHD
jgi:antagonist of KipI